MQPLTDYLRLPEGRFIASLLGVIALLDVTMRLWPSSVSESNAVRSERASAFERIEPSGQFRAWVDARQAAKDEALAVRKAAEAKKNAQPQPKEPVKKVFVDRQSGQLQDFRVGSFKYRLGGGVSLKTAGAGSPSAFAVLRPDKGESKVVTVGEMVGDYTVLSVQDRSVGFKAKDGRVVTLELFERRG